MSTTETKPETIDIVVSPDLARQLADAEAAGKRPILVRDGARYQLDPVEASSATREKQDIWADYDPKKVHEALDATAGSWSDVDAEKLIADIYRWREEGTRPPDRP